MKSTWRTFATLTAGGFIGLVLGFAAILGTEPADAGAGDIPPIITNKAAKQDRADSGAHAVVRRTLPREAAVSQVEIAGPSGAVVTLLDSQGRVIFQSDPGARETVVVRNAVLPTELRDEPGRKGNRPLATLEDAVRAAKANPEGLLVRMLDGQR